MSPGRAGGVSPLLTLVIDALELRQSKDRPKEAAALRGSWRVGFVPGDFAGSARPVRGRAVQRDRSHRHDPSRTGRGSEGAGECNRRRRAIQ